MAMGSGAFLIQGCRFLAEYLIQCWAEAEENEQSSGGAQSRHFSYTCSSGEKRTICLPRIRDTRETLALRLVAENCLYGVDKNLAVKWKDIPLAADICQISVTFLDDALKCGDAWWGEGTNDMVHFESVSGRNLGTLNRVIMGSNLPLRLRLSEEVLSSPASFSLGGGFQKSFSVRIRI